MNKSEAILRMSVIQTTYMNMINAFKDSDVDEKTLEEIQRYVDSLETAMKCLSGTEVLNKDMAENKDRAEKTTYQQGRADAIDEFVKRIYESLGIADATKFGNKNDEQRHNSYSTWMCYEIKDEIDDVAAK